MADDKAASHGKPIGHVNQVVGARIGVQIDVIPGIGRDDADHIDIGASTLDGRREGREAAGVLAFVAEGDADQAAIRFERNGGGTIGDTLVGVWLQDSAFIPAVLTRPGPVPHFVGAAQLHAAGHVE